MNNTVGILALQGAYQKHVDTLNRLSVKSQLVRKASELESCSALILPGGESTTISLLIQKNNLHKAIKDFAKNHGIMGVCAGMIMMANDVDDERVIPLGLMPFKALRNFYGRQVNSFTADIKLSFDDHSFNAPFIRAPSIDGYLSTPTDEVYSLKTPRHQTSAQQYDKNLPSAITILATHKEATVMIGTGKHVALSFHPELTSDTRIHKYWLSKLSLPASNN